MSRKFGLFTFMPFAFITIIVLYFNYFFSLQAVNLPEEFEYSYNSFSEIDSFSSVDGFILYVPENYNKDSIHVVVFTHGWGAHNPVAYGAWIKHLVFQGYAVIFPRYQKGILTRPSTFTQNTAIGINSALSVLEKELGIRPLTESMILAGHSFGGVISVNLAIQWEQFQIPKPAAVYAVQPGHGPLRTGRISDYSNFPEDIQLLFLVSEKDRITGDNFAREVFELNKGKVHTMNLLTMFKDSHHSESIKARHDDPLAMDPDFDKKTAFLILIPAKLKTVLNQADINGFWKLLDALAKCNFKGTDCDIAFGGTKAQKFMGYWSDGTTVKPMQVEM